MGLTGGCMCGMVRYELKEEPFDCGWCHCRTCQLNSGAPAQPYASVNQENWITTAGEDAIKVVKTSSFGQRTFCGNCGTPLYFQVTHQPKTVDFSVVTLDDPSAVEPGFHIFWSSKVPWFNPGDDLPKYDRFRPDTVGLSGTEPPDDSSLVGGT